MVEEPGSPSLGAGTLTNIGKGQPKCARDPSAGEQTLENSVSFHSGERTLGDSASFTVGKKNLTAMSKTH